MNTLKKPRNPSRLFFILAPTLALTLALPYFSINGIEARAESAAGMTALMLRDALASEQGPVIARKILQSRGGQVVSKALGVSSERYCFSNAEELRSALIEKLQSPNPRIQAKAMELLGQTSLPRTGPNLLRERAEAQRDDAVLVTLPSLLNFYSASLRPDNAFVIQSTGSKKVSFTVRFKREQAYRTLGARPVLLSDPTFEVFASKLATEISTQVVINPVELATAQEAKEIYDALIQHKLLDNTWKTVKPAASIAMTAGGATGVFPGAKPVSEVFRLGRNTVVHTFLEKILEMLQKGSIDPYFRTKSAEFAARVRLLKSAPKRPDIELSALLETLSVLFPEARFETQNDFDHLFFMRGIDGSFLGPALLGTDEAAASAIRMALLAQSKNYFDGVAELWAIGNILGVPNLNANNVLWDGEKLIAPNLSFPGPRFLKGEETPNAGVYDQEIAVSIETDSGSYAPALGQLFLDSLTPQFLDRLSGLTPELINRLASISGFKLTSRQMQGIIARAQHVQAKDLGVNPGAASR